MVGRYNVIVHRSLSSTRRLAYRPAPPPRPVPSERSVNIPPPQFSLFSVVCPQCYCSVRGLLCVLRCPSLVLLIVVLARYVINFSVYRRLLNNKLFCRPSPSVAVYFSRPEAFFVVVHFTSWVNSTHYPLHPQDATYTDFVFLFYDWNVRYIYRYTVLDSRLLFIDSTSSIQSDRMAFKGLTLLLVTFAFYNGAVLGECG